MKVIVGVCMDGKENNRKKVDKNYKDGRKTMPGVLGLVGIDFRV